MQLIIKCLFDREENMLDKGENAGNLHFLLFSDHFQNQPSLSGMLKRRHCAVMG